MVPQGDPLDQWLPVWVVVYIDPPLATGKISSSSGEVGWASDIFLSRMDRNVTTECKRRD